MRKISLLTVFFIGCFYVSLSFALNIIDSDTYNGHTYYLLEKSTWTDAEKKAVELGGHLVTINDASENQWIYNKWENDKRWLWHGLYDPEGKNNWVWVSGEANTYRNWNSGEPNLLGTERYGSMWGRGLWNNFSNDSGIYAVHGVIEVIPASADCKSAPKDITVIDEIYNTAPPVVFNNNTFTLNFPSYCNQVDIYFAILTSENKLIFVDSNSKLTQGLLPYVTKIKSAIKSSFSVSGDILASELTNESVLYWLIAPSNGGDIIKSIELGKYELGFNEIGYIDYLIIPDPTSNIAGAVLNSYGEGLVFFKKVANGKLELDKVAIIFSDGSQEIMQFASGLLQKSHASQKLIPLWNYGQCIQSQINIPTSEKEAVAMIDGIISCVQLGLQDVADDLNERLRGADAYFFSLMSTALQYNLELKKSTPKSKIRFIMEKLGLNIPIENTKKVLDDLQSMRDSDDRNFEYNYFNPSDISKFDSEGNIEPFLQQDTLDNSECSPGTVTKIYCSIPNGDGNMKSICGSNGLWGEYSNCEISSCNSGYEQSGNQCIKEQSSNECSPGSTDAIQCDIPGGLGFKKRSCNSNGSWGTFGTCELSHCNTGYYASGNQCIAETTVTPDENDPNDVSYDDFEPDDINYDAFNKCDTKTQNSVVNIINKDGSITTSGSGLKTGCFGTTCDGKKVGTWICYSEDYKTKKIYLRSVDHYVNGILNGNHYSYNEYGDKEGLQGQYENGKENGTWYSYICKWGYQGTDYVGCEIFGTFIYSITTWSYGVRHGPYYEYINVGNSVGKSAIGQYNDGERSGTWQFYVSDCNYHGNDYVCEGTKFYSTKTY